MKEKRTKTETTQTFADRLNSLVNCEKEKNPKGMSEGKVADSIGLNRPALHKYLDNDAEIGINSLVKIAKYFNVSTDYLLGLTDASPRELSNREICEATNLSSNAVRGLNNLTRKSTAFSSVEDIGAWDPDQFDIELPPLDQFSEYQKAFQHMEPSRHTIINEMLCYDGFAQLVDHLRDCVSSNLINTLHQQFAAIHEYYQADIEAYGDKIHCGATKYQVQEDTAQLILHLTEAYYKKHQTVFEDKLQQYTAMVDEYLQERDAF